MQFENQIRSPQKRGNFGLHNYDYEDHSATVKKKRVGNEFNLANLADVLKEE
mgnify:CR=1 FL=1